MLNIKIDIQKIYNYEIIINNLSEKHLARYTAVFEDEELKKFFLTCDEEDIKGQVEIWKRKAEEYAITNDYKFYLYAMYLFLEGYNLKYGLSFLYAQGLKVRHDELLQETLKELAGQAAEYYSNEQIFTKEEKIEELLQYNMCAFSDDKIKEKESPIGVCRYYHNCRECLEKELTEEYYSPILGKIPKKNKH